MTLFAIPYPAIDPVIFQVGPVAIRWYALAYMAGLVLGWRMVIRLAARQAGVVSREDVDDFLVWATFGVILGGRIGYVLFYNFDYYLGDPAAIFQVWRGGMSFHGGLLGVAAAGLIFVRRRGIPALRFADMLAVVAPIGLFFGRLANFINGELFGRVTDIPWAMVFPHGGPLPRHPSQLYEATLEGVVLFAVLFALSRNAAVRARPGLMTGVFLAGYGLARAGVEQFRQPDVQLGTLLGGTTMGQWLSGPMVVAGLILIAAAMRRAEEKP